MAKQKKPKNQLHHNLQLQHIVPKTDNQRNAFDSFFQGKNLMLTGAAGTGKTFIALYLAFNELLKHCQYKRVIVIRSAVPTRDIGFLPGTEQEKLQAYTLPYKQILLQLFGRGDVCDIVTTKGMFEVMSTSYIRGLTLDNCIVVVDECQSANWHELSSVITRVGENCRIMFVGDLAQTDLLKSKNDVTGLPRFYNIIKKLDEFDTIEFGVDDIVRSGLVKSYLMEVAAQENSPKR